MQASISKTNLIYAFLISGIMIALSFAFTSITASAHGYVDNPSSRAVLCEDGINFDCGGVEYEPQSVEGNGNFPEEGVADGEIASGGGVFPELDQQGEDRWAKVPMSSGEFTFHWTLTAAHATRNWDYYITKEDWDPNSPITRDDLELFCTYNDGGKRPDFSVDHDCVIPDREGYHVILAYWEVFDTANAFYQVIDANFDGDFVDPEEPGDGDGDGDGNDNGDNDANAWDNSAVYLGGDEVTYEGDTYRAKWWTLGDTPGDSIVWELISDNNGDADGNEDNGDTDGNEDNGNQDSSSDLPVWSADTVYLNGDKVSYDGDAYTAKWWTSGEKPNSSAVWELQ